MTLLTVDHLEVRYGDLIGVADVSLEIPASSIVALLGSNGAGKTTTLNAIAGLIQRPKDRSGWNREDRRQAGPCDRTSGARVIAGGMAVVRATKRREESPARCDPVRDRQRKAALLERVYALFPRLAERRHQRAGTMSGGERQMLAIGRALMSDPKLLMLTNQVWAWLPPSRTPCTKHWTAFIGRG